MRWVGWVGMILALVWTGALEAQEPEPLGGEALPLAGHIDFLSNAQRAIFLGAPEDVEPEERAKDAHFFVGNELNLHVFYEALKGLGGAYVGVGSDQAYLLIGWQRPQVGWLIDYDRVVVDTHLVHHAFFLAAESPEAYLEFWKKPTKEQSREILRTTYADHPRLENILEVYDDARPYVYRRYQKMEEHFEDRNVPTFLTDATTYAFVREMIRKGRLRPMLVNLLDDRGMVGVGEAARELGVPIRVLYTSNAEQYWDYTAQFRTNIEALYVDERSTVVRTIGRSKTTFNYNLQSVGSFKLWLTAGVEDIFFIRRTRVELDEDVFFTTEGRPPRGVDKKY